MTLVTICVSIILSLFSTAIMSYISMAVPIGPWIAPMLVLIASLFFKVVPIYNDKNKKIALIVAASSVGGILATGCGFSLPTLFFLDPMLFDQWIARPWYFMGMLASISLCAGWFGLWIANTIEHLLIVQEKYEFPISQAIHKMIIAQQQVRKAVELVIGFFGSLMFLVFQQGFEFLKWSYRIPRFVTIIPEIEYGILSIPSIYIDGAILPMLLAIGFIAGKAIIMPLFVGTITKIAISGPINSWMFPAINAMEFLLAFCSGMVIAGSVVGFIKTPKELKYIIESFFTRYKYTMWDRTSSRIFLVRIKQYMCSAQGIEFLMVILLCMIFFTYYELAFFAQLYLLVTTFLCTYQIAVIAGKIGLAQLGRFATFVMVPAMFIFQLTFVHIVFISMFVQIAGGVAADILFSRKLGLLMHLNHQELKKYQYLGLIVSALCIGIIFLILINNFGLGSPELFAQKAYARRLLIDVKNFNIYVLVIGFIFGWILKYSKVNPMLVLGGILMPVTISVGLIIGGMITKLVTRKDEWVPFWSGVFAGNSVWMLLKSFIG